MNQELVTYIILGSAERLNKVKIPQSNKAEEFIPANFINKKDKDLLKNAEVNEENYIKRLIISNIARNIWGNEDYYRIKIKDDQFINKALSNLN